MFIGYYAYAGNEIINGGRTAAYVRQLLPEFPLHGKQGEYDTLVTALDEGEYVSPLVDDAPWVSPDDVSSQDFYGLWPLNVEGVGDSTESATTVEGILNGGYTGAARSATRSIRFHGILVAANELALEAGLTWLRSVLGSQSCGIHSDFCGTSDLNYFLAKPPADSSVEALQAYERTYHKVKTSVGVQAIRRIRTSCGVGLEVDFIIRADNPAAYSNPIDVSSALVPGVGYFADTVVNYHLTPSAEYPFNPLGGTALVQENLSPNPSVEVAITGYTAIPGTSGTAAATRQAPAATTAYGSFVARCAWTVASTVAGGGMYLDIPVTALLTYSFQINHVRPSLSTRLKMQVEWRTNVGTISTVDGAEFQAAAGTIYSPKMEAQAAPATATVARVKVVSVAGTGFVNWSIGSTLEFDGFIANQGSVVGTYFDGNTLPAGDVVQVLWNGAADLSNSYRLGKYAEGWYSQSSAGLTPVANGGAGSVVTQFRTQTQAYVGTFADRMYWWKAPTDDADVIVGGSALAPSLLGRGRVQALLPYMASIWVRSSKNQRVKIRATWLDAGGSTISTVESVAVAATGATWTRLSVGGTAPSNTVFLSIAVLSTNGAGYTRWAATDYIDCDAAMITLGTVLYDWFSGDTPDAAGYDYEWFSGTLYGFNYAADGFPNIGLPSTRAVEAAAPTVTALVDPDLPVLPTPPAPPPIPNDAIVDQFDWLRYYLPIPATDVPLWAAGVPTIDLTTAAEDIRQVRIRFYPNPRGLAPEAVDPGSFCGEFILSYMPAGATLTIDGVGEIAYAVFAGTTQSVVADQLLYGTDGAPVDWPELSCGLPSLMTVDILPTGDIANLHVGLGVTRKE